MKTAPTVKKEVHNKDGNGKQNKSVNEGVVSDPRLLYRFSSHLTDNVV